MSARDECLTPLRRPEPLEITEPTPLSFILGVGDTSNAFKSPCMFGYAGPEQSNGVGGQCDTQTVLGVNRRRFVFLTEALNTSVFL